MNDHLWVQYTWDLTKLPATAPSIEAAYAVRAAKHADGVMLEEVLRRSYMSEPGWTHDLHPRIETMRKLVRDDLADQLMSFLALCHGTRIIGAAVANPLEDAADHMPVGICVLDEYRSRGLGTFLLHGALAALKEKGLRTARSSIKRGLTADRFLYPKFGGLAKVLDTASAAS